MQDSDSKPGGKRRPLTEFAGARGARFAIFPDSALARKPPQWVVAAELVETSRLWARVTARIDPEWAEPLAAHLVRRSYSEPRWDARRGAAVATEKVSLYGLPIVAARTVMYGRIDPAAARDLFITHALVEGDWRTHHTFFARNQRMLADAEELESKARRRGIVADDDARFGFYDRRIPAEVTSARHFDTWWKQARAADPGLLDFSLPDLIRTEAGQITEDDYPACLSGLPVSYEFSPGEPDDGVTVDIPLARLNQVSAEEFSWQVPGLRQEMVTELIRSLPKQLRTTFVPVPDTARAVLPRLGPARGDLLDALGTELSRLGGVHVPRSAWDESRLPAYLRITFRVVEDGRVLAAGKDLDELRRQLRPRLQATLSEAAAGITRTGLRTWDIGTLPRVFSQGEVRAYPALADAGTAADVRLFETQAQADAAMLRGTRRLILLQVPSGARAVASRLPVSAKLAMSRHPYPGTAALLEDCAAAAADQVISEAGGPAWDQAGFTKLLEAARANLAARTADVVALAARALGEAHQVETSLAGTPSPPVRAAFADLRAQLSGAHLSGVHRRDRGPAAAGPGPLPAGDEPAAGEDAGGTGPGRRADGGGAAGDRGLRADPRRPPARAAGRSGRPRRALDDRGTAGQPVRADPGHIRPRVAAADREGPGSAARLIARPGSGSRAWVRCPCWPSRAGSVRGAAEAGPR